jgi:hypothetical protein
MRTSNNPYSLKAVNLTWNNVSLYYNINLNKQQLSLFKPDDVELAKWKSAVKYHIVIKLKKEKMDSAEAKAQAEAIVATQARSGGGEKKMDSAKACCSTSGSGEKKGLGRSYCCKRSSGGGE